MFITFTATSRAARLFHRQLYDARSTAKLNLAPTTYRATTRTIDGVRLYWLVYLCWIATVPVMVFLGCALLYARPSSAEPGDLSS